jgi:exopolyphosphatase / guanosine-5'-triphosphate,3'-diphosphate pyrophosphatase
MALRWEWRTFGDRFGAADSWLDSIQVEPVVQSDETYLLSAESRDAVKVRAGMIDVKHLERVDENGLELWNPVLKAPLPISTADARAVLAALGVRAPVTRTSYDLSGIAGASTAILVVSVHKARRHFVFGGCMAELTDVRTADRSTHTLAIESEDPVRVAAAVRELGLAGQPNTSVPRGLAAIVERR